MESSVLPRQNDHFLEKHVRIKRSASTERPLPGEAFSLAEKIGEPSRPENQDFMRFTGMIGLAWCIAKINQFIELCADPASWDFEVGGFGRLWGHQELIKHMTSRPGPSTSRTHFVFGIERSASTERPFPGEAFSFAEKIGDPSRPGNQDFTGFTVPAKGIHMSGFPE